MWRIMPVIPLIVIIVTAFDNAYLRKIRIVTEQLEAEFCILSFQDDAQGLYG